MSIEDRVRAATRARTDLVRDIRPLRLPENPPERARRTRFARTWGGWLVPLTAAVAVIVVAVVLVAVKRPPAAGPVPASSRSAAPASSAPASSAPAADPEALPAYFAAISGFAASAPVGAGYSGPAKNPPPDSVIVGDTLTGQRLATVTPPAGSTFTGVTGAADDRTFVLDSVQLAPLLFPTEQHTWQVLTIEPGGAEVTRLTRLSLSLPGAADIIGIALSPDGTKLAVFYELPRAGEAGFPYSGPFSLAVYSLPGGALLRSWTGTDPNHGGWAYGGEMPVGNSVLSWTSDGRRLAFDYRSSRAPSSSLYLREVSLSDPGEDLFAASTVIATIGVSPTTGKGKIWCDSLGVTGDGQAAVCGAEMPKDPPVGATLDALTQPAPWVGCAAPTDPAYPGLAEISLAGDRLTRVLYEAEPKCMGGGYASVLWSSPSGGTVLGAVSYTDDPSMKEHSAVVLYRQGRVTALTWPGAASLLSASMVAF
jgi:hypothetical protein